MKLKDFKSGKFTIFCFFIMSGLFTGGGFAILFNTDSWVIYAIAFLYGIGFRAIFNTLENTFLSGGVISKLMSLSGLVITSSFIFYIGSFTNLVFLTANRVMNVQIEEKVRIMDELIGKNENELYQMILSSNDALQAIRNELLQLAVTEEERDIDKVVQQGPMYDHYTSNAVFFEKRIDSFKYTPTINFNETKKDIWDYAIENEFKEFIKILKKEEENFKTFSLSFEEEDNSKSDLNGLKDLEEKYKFIYDKIKIIKKAHKLFLKNINTIENKTAFFRFKKSQFKLKKDTVRIKYISYLNLLDSLKNSLITVEMPNYRNKVYIDRWNNIFLKNLQKYESKIEFEKNKIKECADKLEIDFPNDLELLPIQKAIYSDDYNSFKIVLFAYFFDVIPLIIFLFSLLKVSKK